MSFLSLYYWDGFAYIVISTGMSGFGLSGFVLAVFRNKIKASPTPFFIIAVVLFSVLVLSSVVMPRFLGIDPFMIFWNFHEYLRLLVLLVLPIIPFTIVFFATGILFVKDSSQAPRLYAADLLGAASGIALAYLVQNIVYPGNAFYVPLLISCMALILWKDPAYARLKVMAVSLLLVLGTGHAVTVDQSPMEMNEYKDLSRISLIPNTRIDLLDKSPEGILYRAKSPLLRDIPGLTLQNYRAVPSADVILLNGNLVSSAGLRGMGTENDDDDLLMRVPHAIPYLIKQEGNTLLYGKEIIPALARSIKAGFKRIDIVEPQALLMDVYRDLAESNPNTVFSRETLRNFLLQNDNTFDIIDINHLGSAVAGNSSIIPDYAMTQEAFDLLIQHLNEGGILAVTMWLDYPPRSGIKLMATALESLKKSNAGPSYSECVLALRSWKTFTLLVSTRPFDTETINLFRDFCDINGFDTVWYHGITKDMTNRYHKLDAPFYFQFLKHELDGDVFQTQWPAVFDLGPVNDQRPYFWDFLTISGLFSKELREHSNWRHFIPLEKLVLLMTLLHVFILGTLTLIAGYFFRNKHLDLNKKNKFVMYFICLGFGYMFVQITLIHSLAAYVSWPLSVFIVIFTMLLFSAFGSFVWSGNKRSSSKNIFISIVMMALIILSTNFIANLSMHVAIWKYTLLLGMAAIIAFFMGCPFPRSLSSVAGNSEAIAWAWGINGISSVIAGPLVTCLLLACGINVTLVIAAAIYLVAYFLFRSLFEENS